jgi:hypothetical protein
MPGNMNRQICNSRKHMVVRWYKWKEGTIRGVLDQEQLLWRDLVSGMLNPD